MKIRAPKFLQSAALEELGFELRSAFREETGAEIMEFAVVLPLLFLVILSIFWFGLAFNIASTAERAAKQSAQTAAMPTCTSCSNNFPNDGQVVERLTAVLEAGHLSAANITPYSPPFACVSTPAPVCSTPQGVEICSNAPVNCGSVPCQNPPAACGTNPARGARVSFAYVFESPVSLGSWSHITIPASAQAQQEDER
jgi:Flp pilus assembly protein TadG